MKIVAISDTHNRHKQIKVFKETVFSMVDGEDKEQEPLGGDIIIHAGDATGRGESGEVEAFIKWYGSLDFSHRILVPGNHDFFFERQPERARELCEQYGVTLLIDESVVVNGVKIHGSPVQPWFHNWAFNRARTLEAATTVHPWIKNHWDLIPDDTDILVTHGPPYGVLDEVVRVDGSSYNPPNLVGCEELMYAVKRIKPDIHIFGHIHCGHGQKHLNGTSFYNVAICDEMYSASMPVTEIDYEKEENNGKNESQSE